VEALRAEGLRVDAMTLPGHEKPQGVMPVSRWEDWAAAIEQAHTTLAAEGLPVCLIGFSTGGTLGLFLARKLAVAKLVLLAPFLAIRHTWKLPAPAKIVVGALANVYPDLPRRAPPVRDPKMRAYVRTIPSYQTFNMRATSSALELIEKVKPLVPQIESPTLILQGRRDSVVEPLASIWLLEQLGSVTKSLGWLDHSDHLLALDYDRQQVITHVKQFLLEP
jgi:carboxylesterase